MSGRIPLGLLVLVVAAGPVAAQTEFEDPLGRFVITLPAGFELFSEQNDQIYQFKRDAVRIVLLVQDGVADPAAAFRKAADSFTGQTVPTPPEGTVFELVVNGNAARQTTYPFEATSGDQQVQLQFFMGAVAIEGANMSVAYMSMLNEKVRDDLEPEIVGAFHSLRMPGTSVLGASEPVPVADALAVVEAPPTPASTFEHNLVTLDIPAGWTATAGSNFNVATIEREGILSLRILGAKKNDLGKSREAILEMLVGAIQSSLPTAKQTRPPREEATAAGDVLLIAEYEGVVVADGREVPQWVLLAAFKDKERGLGYLWMTPPEGRDKALEDVLGILRSTR